MTLRIHQVKPNKANKIKDSLLGRATRQSSLPSMFSCSYVLMTFMIVLFMNQQLVSGLMHPHSTSPATTATPQQTLLLPNILSTQSSNKNHFQSHYNIPNYSFSSVSKLSSRLSARGNISSDETAGTDTNTKQFSTQNIGIKKMVDENTASSTTSSPATTTKKKRKEIKHSLMDMPLFTNSFVTMASSRDFRWWNRLCDICINELEKKGGERVVNPTIQVPDSEAETETSGTIASSASSILKLENSSWNRNDNTNSTVADAQKRTAINLVQDIKAFSMKSSSSAAKNSPSILNKKTHYELRYVATEKMLGGIIRFGDDSEHPKSFVHEGAMTSIVDATVTTLVFKTNQQWGMTSQFRSKYSEKIPLKTPVNLVVQVVDSEETSEDVNVDVEWYISSLLKKDKHGNLVKYAQGSAEILLDI